jgi:hypothetical protein
MNTLKTFMRPFMDVSCYFIAQSWYLQKTLPLRPPAEDMPLEPNRDKRGCSRRKTNVYQNNMDLIRGLDSYSSKANVGAEVLPIAVSGTPCHPNEVTVAYINSAAWIEDFHRSSYNARAAIRKLAKAAGFLTPVGCHTWLAIRITIYLENDERLEQAQQIAGHESPRK